MKIIDGHSGKAKFFKGKGRKGTSSLDDYQKMLIEAEKTNGFQDEPKQKPLIAKERKERGVVKYRSMNQSVRWK